MGFRFAINSNMLTSFKRMRLILPTKGQLTSPDKGIVLNRGWMRMKTLMKALLLTSLLQACGSPYMGTTAHLHSNKKPKGLWDYMNLPRETLMKEVMEGDIFDTGNG